MQEGAEMASAGPSSDDEGEADQEATFEQLDQRVHTLDWLSLA